MLRLTQCTCTIARISTTARNNVTRTAISRSFSQSTSSSSTPTPPIAAAAAPSDLPIATTKASTTGNYNVSNALSEHKLMSIAFIHSQPKKKTQKVISSCPPGTILKGLNYLKDRSDPIALEDAEYPKWLHDLATPPKAKGGKKVVGGVVDLGADGRKLAQERKTGIKARNNLKSR